MKVLITGSEGFIAKNLISKLLERNDIEIIKFNRSNSLEELSSIIVDVDFIFHLAGINRTLDKTEFKKGNEDFTKSLVEILLNLKNKPRVLFASSVQAVLDNHYGLSKLGAENIFMKAKECGLDVEIVRLTNIFGKWCKPNYNSVIATFCHNVASDKPIEIHDGSTQLNLIYIDDVVNKFIDILDKKDKVKDLSIDIPVYQKTISNIVDLLNRFKNIKTSLVVEEVGTGFERALYSTFISYLPLNKFEYPLPIYKDDRGEFVEMLKTKSSGQFSYFTSYPGVSRGSHYHHSKTEKFLVLSGKAKFRFKNILTDEYHEIFSEGGQPKVVETIPGWAHDITNIGKDNLVVMLWANEIFDRDHPDTYEEIF